MMKVDILNAVKQILADRKVAALALLVMLVAIIFSIFVAMSLQPSDVQVAVHYTAFGETNFYREKWFYLISFVFFGVIVATVHVALMIKLYILEQRQLAIAFGWLSVLLITIAWAVTSSILRIAFL